MQSAAHSTSLAPLRWMVIIAAVAYAPALAFYYVGEEAIFPITAIEMWQGGDWIRQHLFGGNLQHNPLFTWLIIPFASLTGWQFMLPVTRALTIGATLASAGILGWLALRLIGDRTLAWFAALIYLTMADVALYRGWLAYVDPLFAMFVFGAIAALWVACAKERPLLLVVAVVSLTCAFMSKAFTAYVFYATAVFVLLFTASGRRVLLGRISIVAHLLALSAPVAWLHWVPGMGGQGGRMFTEIVAKLMPESALSYLKQVFGFPLESAVRMSPALPLAIFYTWRRKIALRADPVLTTAAAMALLCYLPYWFAPVSGIRYLLPIYPLVALASAVVLQRAGEMAMLVSSRWLAGMLVFKVIGMAVLFPYYQHHYRGENYLQTASEIMRISRGYPLYTENDTASGLCVAGYIDSKWRANDPIVWAPKDWQNGFVIAESADPEIGKVKATFKLGGDELYLLCRGAACDAAH